jgi:pimeloyl-ACP methyl ester carboxylesterase
MELDKDMAETVAQEMPARPAAWLTDEELGVYAKTFNQTKFQGGLQWYRCATGTEFTPELIKLSGRTIDVPSMFIAGAADWGIYQKPGEFERMQRGACTQMRGCHLVEGAGHWVQQEQPDAVTQLLIDFLPKVSKV